MTSAQKPFWELSRVEKCTKPGLVAYTFDDGPDVYNDRLLAILKKKNVTATFFLLGQMIDKNAENKASLKKILAHGHQLASHTYTHTNLESAGMTEAKIKDEMIRTSDTMFANAQVRPRYMRAPQGSCEDNCTKIMKGLGYVISYWNADTNDWRHNDKAADYIQLSMTEINEKILTSNPATDSFILLQHELRERSVMELTDVVIDAIQKKGYRFVSMEECIGEAAYTADSVVPPKPSTGVPPVTPTGAPVTPTVAPVVPPPGTPATTSTSSNSVKPSITGGNDKNGAGIKSAAGWTLFLTVAALGSALF
ncbi:hypothetical protein BGX24_012559 [Mortierella sp. AD032]|nr:hypothetical protein BGX24_012559 [Mortierella sp. AD032]